MKLTTDFEKIGLHDASIENIERAEGSIILELKGAYISKDHQGSDGQDWSVEEARLIISGVTGERATYWDDDKSAKEHPKPEFPLDEIMNANFENGVFSFDGFKETESWYEWFITANRFSFEVKSASKFSS